MTRIDYRTLVDMGRKAGLRTSELYPALASQPTQRDGIGGGQADGNGYVAGYTQNGHPTFRPVDGQPHR
jgi:hypothetical protein